jgi:putative transport protein
MSLFTLLNIHVEFIQNYFHNRPVFVTFLAILTGFLISRIRVRGFSIGIAGVLIAGMLLGSIQVSVPSVVKFLGLVMFIFCVGVQAGSKILAIFTKRNAKYLVVAGIIFSIATIFTFIISKLLNLPRDLFLGLYAGVFSSPSAIANVFATHPSDDAMLAYTFSYPLSLFFTLIFINVIVKLFRLSEASDVGSEFADQSSKKEKVVERTVKVQEDLFLENMTVADAENMMGVVITGRVKEDGTVYIDTDTPLQTGEKLIVEGYESDVRRFKQFVGGFEKFIDKTDGGLEERQILVTNQAIDGKSLKELGVRRKFHCTVSKVWRTGLYFPARESWIRLEVGDTLVVLGTPENLDRLTELVGHQNKSLGEVDFLTMSVVIVLGVLLGNMKITGPGGGYLQLGAAGGTLFVSLFLGYLRSNGFTYGMITPQARTVLRELGLIFFMLGVGADAGRAIGKYTFDQLLNVFWAAMIIAGGFLLIIFLLIIFSRGRVKESSVLAVFCGSITNTPAIGLVVERTGSENLMVPFASVYPVATVMLLLLAQLLYLIY